MPHLFYLDGTHKVLQWRVGTFLYAQARIPINASVLEIGGGNDPHPVSQVILDKFLDDNLHRSGQEKLLRKPPALWVDTSGKANDVTLTPAFVCGDAEQLPFPDQSFDFIIAKDILEHCPDIEQAFSELQRVGHSGIVDVPKMSSEWLFQQKIQHQWTFSRVGETIVAHKVDFDSPFGNLMHETFAKSAEIQKAWSLSRHYFHMVYLWDKKIDLKIGRPAMEEFVSNPFAMREYGERT